MYWRTRQDGPDEWPKGLSGYALGPFGYKRGPFSGCRERRRESVGYQVRLRCALMHHPLHPSTVVLCSSRRHLFFVVLVLQDVRHGYYTRPFESVQAAQSPDARTLRRLLHLYPLRRDRKCSHNSRHDEHTVVPVLSVGVRLPAADTPHA